MAVYENTLNDRDDKQIFLDANISSLVVIDRKDGKE